MQPREPPHRRDQVVLRCPDRCACGRLPRVVRWIGPPTPVSPLEAVARIDLPDAYGAPVSHLQVSLEVVARFRHAGLASKSALSISRLHELVDALVASLVDDEVTKALAALAGVEPLVMPQPLGLDFLSSTDTPDLLAGNGLTLVPDAGTSHGANLLADPGIDQRDPAERRSLIDSWLHQISLDAGLLGMEQILERLHAASPCRHPGRTLPKFSHPSDGARVLTGAP